MTIIAQMPAALSFNSPDRDGCFHSNLLFLIINARIRRHLLGSRNTKIIPGRSPTRSLLYGAFDFLTKPFRDQDLIDRVQRALQQDAERGREFSHADKLPERLR